MNVYFHFCVIYEWGKFNVINVNYLEEKYNDLETVQDTRQSVYM